MCYWEKTTEVKHYFHHIILSLLFTWLISVNADLDHLADVVFLKFLYCKVILFFPFPYYTIWKEVTMHRLLSFKVEYLRKLFVKCFAQEICFFLPIYLFPQLLVYISMDLSIFSFICWFIISQYFILWLKLFQPWPLGVLSVGFYVTLIYYTVVFCLFSISFFSVFFFSFFSYITRCSRLIWA